MNDYRENDAIEAHAEQHAEANRWRELDLKEALEECKAKGISSEALRTLIFETGAYWPHKENV